MPSLPAVCITTIRPPTDAVRAWIDEGHELFVALDDQSPRAAWSPPPPRTTVVTPETQATRWPRLHALTRRRHYAVKNFAYLAAWAAGHEWVFETDDDNWPIAPGPREWPTEPSETGVVAESGGWVNTYAYHGHPEMWPRGLPLSARDREVSLAPAPERHPCALWQFMHDGEPDRGAEQRLATPAVRVEFRRDKAPLLLRRGTLAPVNSQATLWHRGAAGDMYIPSRVPGRCSDIIRGYVALAAAHARGAVVAVRGPVTRQERNPHDAMEDLREEAWLLAHGDDFMRRLVSGELRGDYAWSPWDFIARGIFREEATR